MLRQRDDTEQIGRTTLKNKILMGCLLGVASQACQAALPPQYQRLDELKAILDDERVVAALRHASPIDRIEHVGPDTYKVSAGVCTLHVGIKEKPLPDGMVGRRQFDLEIGAADCPAR